MTSVLRRITGLTFRRCCGEEDSQERLRELSHANLFIIPLDEEGEWYRYHHLFSDLLLEPSAATRVGPGPARTGERMVRGRGFFDTPSGMPSRPQTMSAQPSWSRAIGPGTRSPATQRPWSGGSDRYPKGWLHKMRRSSW